LVQPIPAPFLKSHGAKHETGGLESYPAYDFFADPGSPVIAVVTGTVRKFSGYPVATGWHDNPGEAFGNSIYIRGESGSDYYYTHLDDKFNVGEGDSVSMGQQLGTVAAMTSVTPHCHFGVNPSHDGFTIYDVGSAQIAQKIK
jgi:murein DD-endopeptidase MepM/ murein hydrolase activator NlpD